MVSGSCGASRGFAIGALALGIGANSAVFSVVDAVLVRPLPCHESGSGRFFTSADTAAGMPVAIVNESFANRHFPGQSAIGRRFQIGGMGVQFPWYSIAGVVIRERGINVSLKPGVYLNHPQARYAWPIPDTLVIRTAGEPAVVAATARAAIWSIDKDQPITRVRTMDDVIASELALPSKSSALLSAFSILALLLSGLGIYGVLSHAVARRQAEIGVRMALGATPVSIVRLVASRGFALAGAGLVIGMAASIPVSRLMSTLLHEVPPVDWLTIGASGLTLLAVAALALAFPARRAANLDPVVALREE